MTSSAEEAITVADFVKQAFLILQARLGDFAMGALDVNSASPRRYFLEVLQHFATEESQKERLQHFASGEGREDLNLYNQSEGT